MCKNHDHNHQRKHASFNHKQGWWSVVNLWHHVKYVTASNDATLTLIQWHALYVLCFGCKSQNLLFSFAMLNLLFNHSGLLLSQHSFSMYSWPDWDLLWSHQGWLLHHSSLGLHVDIMGSNFSEKIRISCHSVPISCSFSLNCDNFSKPCM